MSNDQFAAGTVPGANRYYVVLFGRWNGIRLEAGTAHLLVSTHRLAHSADVSSSS